MTEANEFIASEITSDHVENELRKWSSMFSWIDDDSSATYFELVCAEVPACMENIAIMASKTYTRGLILISIYHDGTIYFMMTSGEGDQQLLDVRFPDVSKHGQGLQLCSYNSNYQSASKYQSPQKSADLLDSVSSAKLSNDDPDLINKTISEVISLPSSNNYTWRKLTLWHILDNSHVVSGSESKVHVHIKEYLPKLKTLNVSSSDYQQTCKLILWNCDCI